MIATFFPIEAWAEQCPWRTRTAFFLVGGLLMVSFAPFGFYPLAPLFLLPLLLAFSRLRPKVAAQIGFCFGAGLFIAGTYWLYVSIHVFGQAPLLLALLLMLCLVLIMAVYYAATGWVIARCCGIRLWQLVILAPSVWVFFEWLRGWLLSGFPWMTLGYSQIDAPLASFAPLLGVYGVSFFLVMTSSAVLGVICSTGKERLVFLLIAVAPWLAGMALSNIQWTIDSGRPVQTTIVQGGVSQDRKWLREQFRPTLTLYRESIMQNPDAALLIWPEVAIPAVLNQVEDYLKILEEDLAPRNQSLLFGILERPQAGGKVFNSVVAIGGGARQVYRKRHLVPFGEYFPVPQFVREWMRLMNLPYSDISPGDAVQPLLTTADGTRLSVAICYEDAYASEQLYALPDAEILINVSNDAWFGDSIAPHQHLQIARMRALEVNRHVVRATNNGVSAFIGPSGEILQQGPQFEFVTMSHAVQPRAGLTPFARAGNWPVILFATLVLAGFAGRRRKA